MTERSYFVYILSNRTRLLYIGVTNNLELRLRQHRQHENDGFTARYHILKLVYFEQTGSILDAIAREKQLKKWRRAKKVALIDAINPKWQDLSETWYR